MHFFGQSPELTADLALRRERICVLLREQGADAMIATTNVNLFYLTGLMPDGYFYMDAQGLCVLFLRRPHSWQGKGIVPIKHPGQIPELLRKLDMPLPKRLMLEEELPHSEYQRLVNLFADVIALPSVLRRARSIKTPFEQQIMRRTGAWHIEALKGVPALYRRGMTDIQLATAIDSHFRSLGHPGYFRKAGHRMDAVMGTLLAGANAASPSPFDFSLGGAGQVHMPFSASGEPLVQGSTVLVDESANIEGYLTDVSRIYSIGKLPQIAYDMHEVALEIQAAFVASAQVGARCCDLYNQSLEIAERSGFAHCFMGSTQQARFVGHGLGLEINEAPVIAPRDTTPLQAGMTIALEPKFIVEGVGAVGIENTFLITPDGAECITPGEDAICPLDALL